MSTAWLRPSLWWLHAFAVAAVIACILGGLWQFGIYGDRRHDGSGSAVTTVDGHFAPYDQQVWVSGREQDGRTGYWLLAPFVLNGSDEALLVVRGFRTDTDPFVDYFYKRGRERLNVTMHPGEAAAAPLDDNRVIGSVRIPALANELPHPLRPEFAISRTPTGLELADPPDTDVSWTVGFRNLAYAMQWWVFGAFAIVMWWRICNDQVKQPNGERE